MGHSMYKFISVLTLTLTLATSPCFARGDIRYDAGLLIGRAKQYDESGSILTAWGDSTSFGARLSARFNKYVSADTSYFNNGSIENSHAKVKSSSFQIGLTGTIPMGNIVALNGSFGQSFSSGRYSYTSYTGESIDRSGSGSDPYFAIGISLNIDERYLLYIERSYNEMKWSDYENVTENTALGVAWRFR